MGLFGGFRAKFTKTPKTKANIQEVVCLRYHIRSEFDTPSSSNGHAPTYNIPNNPVPNRPHVKPRRTLINSQIIKSNEKTPKPLQRSRPPSESVDIPLASAKKNMSNLSDGKNRSLSKSEEDLLSPPRKPLEKKRPYSVSEDLPPSLPKTPPPNFEYEIPNRDGMQMATTFTVPNDSTSIMISELTVDKRVREQNGDVSDILQLEANNVLLSLGDDNNTLQQKNTRFGFEKRQVFEEKNKIEENEISVSYGEPSTLIFMTQHSEVDPPETNFDDENETDYVVLSNSIYTADDFKVNMVQYNPDKNYSVSEDDLSTQDLTEQEIMDFTAMGYSSQASSIFFGGDMQPTIHQRQVLDLASDDNEEDC